MDPNPAPPVGDASTQIIPDAADSPSASVQVHDTTQSQQNVKEEWAAIRIQTAFRGFLVFKLFNFVYPFFLGDEGFMDIVVLTGSVERWI